MLQECPGFDGAYAEPFYSGKVAPVVGNDELTTSLNRQFQNHIVSWIRKKGTPYEKDRVAGGHRTMIVDQVLDRPSINLETGQFS